MPMPPRPYGLMSAFDQADPTSPLADTLGMQEQPFYSAATGISQGGYDYMGDLGAALLAGSGWHAGPSSFGENLGQAMQSAEASHSDRLRTQMRNRLQGYEFKRQQRADKIEEQDRAAAAAQAAQRAAILQQMDPRYQALDVLGTGPAAQAAKDQMFPEAVKPIQIGDQLVMPQADGSFKPVYSAPAKAGPLELVSVFNPATGKNEMVPKQQAIHMEPAHTGAAPAQYRRMTPEEEKAAGLPPGPNYINQQTGLPEVVRTPSAGTTVYGPNGEPLVQFGGGMPKPSPGFVNDPGPAPAATGPVGPRMGAIPSPLSSLPDIPSRTLAPGENLYAGVATPPPVAPPRPAGLPPGQSIIEGGTADQLNRTDAGKAAVGAVGSMALDEVTSKLLDSAGGVNYGLLGSMAANLPWSEGRTANQAYAQATEAQLRSLSGAAVTDAELSRIRDMVVPSVLDSPEAVKAKVARSKKFFSMSGSRNFSDILHELNGEDRRERSAGGGLPTANSAAERDALAPGTRYKAPDGTVRIR